MRQCGRQGFEASRGLVFHLGPLELVSTPTRVIPSFFGSKQRTSASTVEACSSGSSPSSCFCCNACSGLQLQLHNSRPCSAYCMVFLLFMLFAVSLTLGRIISWTVYPGFNLLYPAHISYIMQCNAVPFDARPRAQVQVQYRSLPAPGENERASRMLPSF